MDRTERQKLGIKRWLNTGGCASCVFPTGFGTLCNWKWIK